MLFKLPASKEIFVAEWNASDALSFYGSILGFAGTVVLGAVSIFQNRKLHNELNMQEQKSQWYETAMSHKPIFYLKSVSFSNSSDQLIKRDNGVWIGTGRIYNFQKNGVIAEFVFEIINGQHIFNCKMHTKLYTNISETEDQFIFYKPKEMIPTNHLLKIPLYYSQWKDGCKDGIKYLVFDCEDDLNNKYQQIVPLVISYNCDNSTLSMSVHELFPTKLISKWQGEK